MTLSLSSAIAPAQMAANPAAQLQSKEEKSLLSSPSSPSPTSRHLPAPMSSSLSNCGRGDFSQSNPPAPPSPPSSSVSHYGSPSPLFNTLPLPRSHHHHNQVTIFLWGNYFFPSIFSALSIFS